MKNCTYPSCNKLFTPVTGSYGKYCSLSCGTTHRNYLNKIKAIDNYSKSPRVCLQCNQPLSFDKRKNNFCSKSCSGIYTNAQKDYSKIKSGPSKGTKKPGTKIPFTLISQCIICNKYHPKKGKTCSIECKSSYVSLRVRGKTGGNTDCNKPGVDSFGKRFFYDSNWEIKLAESLTNNSIKWQRPDKFILSDGRSYTPDFYLPEYNVYIDPKAKRPGYYRQSILKIEMFEEEFSTRCLVVTNEKLLHWYHIQTLLLVGSNRS